jgi:hypothetical protein
MAATGVMIQISVGRDNLTPMLCLDSGAVVCPVWHTLSRRQEPRIGGSSSDMERQRSDCPFAETRVLRWEKAADQTLRLPSGVAIRSALLLIAQRTRGAVHDNSPGGSTYMRLLVQSGGAPHLSFFGAEL